MEEPKEVRGIACPFDAYDVFGYLIPGLSFLFLISFYEHELVLWLGHGRTLPVLYVLETLWNIMTSQTSWGVTLFVLACTMCVVYACGHIIASVSSLLVDRVLVSKGHGYPYQHLLSIREPELDRASMGFYRGTFLWTNLLLIVVYGAQFSERSRAWRGEVLVTVGLAIAVVVILKVLYSFLMAKKPYRELTWLRKRKWPKVTLKAAGWFLAYVYPLPYNLFASMLGNYLRTKRGFDDTYVQRYKGHFMRVFRTDPDGAGTNNYWSAYCHVATKNPALARIARRWLYLYGFCRNQSMAFYLAFAYSVFCLATAVPGVSQARRTGLFVWPGVFLVCWVLLMFRYYYLYAGYYSKFIFRAFVYVESVAGTAAEAQRVAEQGYKESVEGE